MWLNTNSPAIAGWLQARRTCKPWQIVPTSPQGGGDGWSATNPLKKLRIWVSSFRFWVQTHLKRLIWLHNVGFPKGELLAWRWCRNPMMFVISCLFGTWLACPGCSFLACFMCRFLACFMCIFLACVMCSCLACLMCSFFGMSYV